MSSRSGTNAVIVCSGVNHIFFILSGFYQEMINVSHSLPGIQLNACSKR